jgi:hypothetical protein
VSFTVEVAGHGIVNHAGSAVLRLLSDGLSLTGRLSRALAHRDFQPVHDRGRVPTDTAVVIADGGRVLSDLDTLRDQGELFGPVASTPTLRRALAEIDQLGLDRIAAARATVAEAVLIVRHVKAGPEPTVPVGGVPRARPEPEGTVPGRPEPAGHSQPTLMY